MAFEHSIVLVDRLDPTKAEEMIPFVKDADSAYASVT